MNNTNSIISRQPATSNGSDLIKPEARVPISIRVAVAGKGPSARDFEFIDSLQKQHSKALGFMYRTQLETYIERGDVLIAEEKKDDGAGGLPVMLGYAIGRDQYFKRDDVGIIYQLCVSPGSQRSLIGAMLVKAMFEKSAYGCKLFCCWCAQDLQANMFWESLGFVPLAFRTGSARTAGKERIHIFWQRRIREEENQKVNGAVAGTATPWWYPSTTTGGSLRADRIVLPIPPGTRWQDAKPVVVPGMPEMAELESTDEEVVKPQPAPRRKGKKKRVLPGFATMRNGELITNRNDSRLNMPWMENEEQRIERLRVEAEAKKPPKRKARKKTPKSPAAKKHEAKLVAAARELRDRYLEAVNAPGSKENPSGEQLLSMEAGKYDVSRSFVPLRPSSEVELTPLPVLDAA